MQLHEIRKRFQTVPAPQATLAVLLLVLLFGLLAQWLNAGFTLIYDPANASVSEDDYRQYLTGWASGIGTHEVAEFLRKEATRKQDRPIWLVVGGFGRHGNWAIAPRLRDIQNLKVHVAFLDNQDTLRNLVDVARLQRVLVIEEPPVYEISPSLLAEVSPAPRVVFRYDRQMVRLGRNDGGFRVWEFSPASRLKHSAPAGPPVSPAALPTIESLTNPNGLEGTPERRFFWLGGGATRMVVSSGKPALLEMSADMRTGPSFAGPLERRLLVRTTDDFEEIVSFPPGRHKILVPLPAGRTAVEVLPLDPANQPINPNGDPRPMIFGFDDFKTSFTARTATADHTLNPASCAIEFGRGAYREEKIGKGTGWLRWTDGELTLRLFSSRASTAVVSGEYLSMVRPETVSVLLEGQKIGTIEVPASADTLLPFPPIQLELPAGDTTLVLRANKQSIQPAGDSRKLNFGLANVTMKTRHVNGNCVLR